MNEERQISWNEANQRYLLVSLQVVRQELENYLVSRDTKKRGQPSPTEQEKELTKATRDLSSPSALENLVNVFGLSSFEQKILLMCAGPELDSEFNTLFATANNQYPIYPSFSLALAAFSDAHWSALTPGSPLRYWRLIEPENTALLTNSPLRIDEQILHYLTGVYYLNEHLEGLLEPIFSPEQLPPSQAVLAEKIRNVCYQSPLPFICLKGAAGRDARSIAAAACVGMGLQMYALPVYHIPGNAREDKELIRRWNREAALNTRALFIDMVTLDTNDKLRVQGLISLISQVQGVLILCTGDWVPEVTRAKVEFPVEKPTREEQLIRWQQNLGNTARQLTPHLKPIIDQFNLSAEMIDATSLDILTQSSIENMEDAELYQVIWRTCCIHTRPRIDELAQRIDSAVGWDDLVLPDAQIRLLQEIALQVRHRHTVYQEWGFRHKNTRGLGITALFSGDSGTGKTLASEVLANELDLDLYRIDLSQVVNKYIGETEKNLKRIFDAAEESGAILLFDEADALFGKRSEVKDSHDRYSNIEVSYLLQRMEAYAGLAILTTNMKSALDKAFLRRIRFLVPFPYPDANHRAEIWKRAFPTDTPTQDLDYDKLARLNIPGGNIRNVALNAAFIAADALQPVGMSHILRAARTEYHKLDKTLSNNEIGQWL